MKVNVDENKNPPESGFSCFVETVGVEPTTSTMPLSHSSQLSYAPKTEAQIYFLIPDLQKRLTPSRSVCQEIPG